MDKIEPLFGDSDVELKPESHNIVSPLEYVAQQSLPITAVKASVEKPSQPVSPANIPPQKVAKQAAIVKQTVTNSIAKRQQVEAQQATIAYNTMRLSHTLFLTWLLQILSLTLYKFEEKTLAIWLLMVGSFVCLFVAVIMCVALDAKRRERALTSFDWFALVFAAPIYVPAYLLVVYSGYRTLLVLASIYGLLLVNEQFITYVMQLAPDFWLPIWQLFAL